MNPQQCQELAQKMDQLAQSLNQMQANQTPTDAALDAYNAIREAAHDLLNAVNRIIEG